MDIQFPATRQHVTLTLSTARKASPQSSEYRPAALLAVSLSSCSLNWSAFATAYITPRIYGQEYKEVRLYVLLDTKRVASETSLTRQSTAPGRQEQKAPPSLKNFPTLVNVNDQGQIQEFWKGGGPVKG